MSLHQALIPPQTIEWKQADAARSGMTPLQVFFSGVRASIEFQKGGGDALHCVEQGGYRDAADLIKCMLLEYPPSEPRFIPKEKMEAASCTMSFLRALVLNAPEAIPELQAYGLSFLERAAQTTFFDQLTPGRSLYAHLVDSYQTLKAAFWEHYDARQGLNSMMFSAHKLGYSTNEEGYHTDLIVKIMDAVQDDADEQAVIDYLASCRATGHTPEINWGVYLHPNATPYIQAWIPANQRANTLMTDSPLISAALKNAYARPAATLAFLMSRGVAVDVRQAVERIAQALDVSAQDQVKLGWLLCPDPAAFKAMYDTLDADEQQELLLFGFKNRLPLPGSYVPGQSELKRGMVEGCFLSIAQAGLSERFARAAIDYDVARRNSEESSWWSPLIVQAQPAYFLDQLAKLDAQDAFRLIVKTVKAISAYTSVPERPEPELAHGDVSITIGQQSTRNGQGILLKHQGALVSLEALFDTIRTALDLTVQRAMAFEVVQRGQVGSKPRPIKAVLKDYFQSVKEKDCLNLVIHDLLDKTGVQVALSLKSLKPLLTGVDFPHAVIEKMTPGQQAAVLERDLGL